MNQGSYFYYMPIALYDNQAWITFTNRFAYGHTYYVTCDTGLFVDSTGASFPGITGTNAWTGGTFTTTVDATGVNLVFTTSYVTPEPVSNMTIAPVSGGASSISATTLAVPAM